MKSGGSMSALEAAHLFQDGSALQLQRCTQTEGTLWVLCSFLEKPV